MVLGLGKKKERLTQAERLEQERKEKLVAYQQKLNEVQDELRAELAKLNPDDYLLNFQKLDIIDARIAMLRKKENELIPLVAEEVRERRNHNGKYFQLQKRVSAELKAAENERDRIRKTISANGEPDTDPIKKVTEKYRAMEAYNRRRSLLASTIKSLEGLMSAIQEIDRLWIPATHCPKKDRSQDLANISSLHYNYYLEYSQMRPMTTEQRDQEISAAAAQVAELMTKAQEEKKMAAEISAFV